MDKNALEAFIRGEIEVEPGVFYPGPKAIEIDRPISVHRREPDPE